MKCPTPEIADISGISEGNLRVKIYRIKQKLASYITTMKTLSI